jgi:hypothetical protein
MNREAIDSLAKMLCEIQRGEWTATQEIRHAPTPLAMDFVHKAGVAYNPGVWLDLNLTAGKFQAGFFGFMILDKRFPDLNYTYPVFAPYNPSGADAALAYYFDIGDELLDLLRLSNNWEPTLDELSERVNALSAYLTMCTSDEAAAVAFKACYEDEPMERSYRVAWEVDVEATSAEEAALKVAGSYFRKGLEHGKPGTACVFEVTPAQQDGDHLPETVDLAKIGDWSKTAGQLKAKYGVGGCPHAPLTRWRSEVLHECETRGYWDWVVDILATNQE